MVNLAGTSQALDTSLNTIYEGFKILRDETGVMRSIATFETLKPHEGRSKNINNYGRVLAFSVADGVDVTQAQALADSTTTYTPGEVAVQVILAGSTMRRVADPDLLGRTGRMLAAALDLKEYQDGGREWPSFTPIMGLAGNILGPFEYIGAVTRLMIGNDRANPEPPPMPYFTVDHPIKLITLANRIVPLSNAPTGTDLYTPATRASGLTVGTGYGGGAGLSGDILRQGIGALGTFFGTTVKKTANLIPDASADVSGAVLSREGLVYVQEVAPKLEKDMDPSMRGAVELTLWNSYVWGLWRPGAYGCETLGDASMPVAS